MNGGCDGRALILLRKRHRGEPSAMDADTPMRPATDPAALHEETSRGYHLPNFVAAASFLDVGGIANEREPEESGTGGHRKQIDSRCSGDRMNVIPPQTAWQRP